MSPRAHHQRHYGACALGRRLVTIYYMRRAHCKALAPVVWYLLTGVGAVLATCGGTLAHVGNVLIWVGLLRGLGPVLQVCKSELATVNAKAKGQDHSARP